MAAPNITSTTATVTTGNVTSYSANYPATVDAGDLLIIVSLSSLQSSVVSYTGDLATNELSSEASSAHYTASTYLIAAGTEGGGTFTVNHSSNRRGCTLCIRIAAAEWHGTTPPEVATTADTTQDKHWAAQSLTISGWNPATDNNDSLIIGLLAIRAGDLTVSGFPTELVNDQNADAIGSGVFNNGMMALGSFDTATTDGSYSEALTVVSGTVSSNPFAFAIRGAAGASNPSASGAATTPAATASGTATVRRQASGAVTLPAATASGTATVRRQASGAATTPAATASGTATVRRQASGAATTPAATAAGTATVVPNNATASGDATLGAAEAAGQASVRRQASGGATLGAVEAAGQASIRRQASGDATLGAVTASGTATVTDTTLTAEGAATVPAVVASGAATVRKQAQGAATMRAVRASGAANLPDSPVITTGGGSGGHGAVVLPRRDKPLDPVYDTDDVVSLALIAVAALEDTYEDG